MLSTCVTRDMELLQIIHNGCSLIKDTICIPLMNTYFLAIIKVDHSLRRENQRRFGSREMRCKLYRIVKSELVLDLPQFKNIKWKLEKKGIYPSMRRSGQARIPINKLHSIRISGRWVFCMAGNWLFLFLLVLGLGGFLFLHWHC